MAYEDYENEEETEDEEENEESSESSENANAGNNTQAPVNTPAPTPANNQPIDTAIKAGQEAQQPTAPAQGPATPAQTSTLPENSPFTPSGQSSDSTSNNTNDVVAKMKGAGLDDETISALQQINYYALTKTPEEFQNGLATVAAQNKNLAALYSQYYGQAPSTSGQQTPNAPGAQALTSSYYNSINIDPNKTYGQVDSKPGYVYSYDAKQLQNQVNRAIFDYNKKIANGTIEGKTAADYIQPLKVDGMYGSKTKAAIDALQKAGYNVTNLPASVGGDSSSGNSGASQSGSSTSSDNSTAPNRPMTGNSMSAALADAAKVAAEEEKQKAEAAKSEQPQDGTGKKNWLNNIINGWNDFWGIGNANNLNSTTTPSNTDVGEPYSFNWFVNEYMNTNPNASEEEARAYAGQQIIGIQNGDIPRPETTQTPERIPLEYSDAFIRQQNMNDAYSPRQTFNDSYMAQLERMQEQPSQPIEYSDAFIRQQNQMDAYSPYADYSGNTASDDIQSSGSRGLGGRPAGIERSTTEPEPERQSMVGNSMSAALESKQPSGPINSEEYYKQLSDLFQIGTPEGDYAAKEYRSRYEPIYGTGGDRKDGIRFGLAKSNWNDGEENSAFERDYYRHLSPRDIYDWQQRTDEANLKYGHEPYGAYKRAQEYESWLADRGLTLSDEAYMYDLNRRHGEYSPEDLNHDTSAYYDTNRPEVHYGDTRNTTLEEADQLALYDELENIYRNSVADPHAQDYTDEVDNSISNPDTIASDDIQASSASTPRESQVGDSMSRSLADNQAQPTTNIFAQDAPPVITPERENQYKTLFNNEISALHQMYPDASYSQLYDYLNLFYQQNGDTNTEYYKWFNSFL